ncbi:Murein DD-endopeptidase MepS/Murein LD-carboxypeptidase precursor [compost metagenome]
MNTTHTYKRFRNLSVGVCLGAVLLTAGTGFIGGGSTAYAATAKTTSSSTASSLAEKIIATGMKFEGVPYEYGAEAGNTSSFDCSSFTQYIFEQNGVTLPRSSKEQSTAGTYVARDDLQPGDLVFFYSPIHHVAVYMGDGKILHTYGEGGVTVTSLDSGWWDSHYTTARRVLSADQQAGTGSGTTAATPDTDKSSTDKDTTTTDTDKTSTDTAATTTDTDKSSTDKDTTTTDTDKTSAGSDSGSGSTGSNIPGLADFLRNLTGGTGEN